MWTFRQTRPRYPMDFDVEHAWHGDKSDPRTLTDPTGYETHYPQYVGSMAVYGEDTDKRAKRPMTWYAAQCLADRRARRAQGPLKERLRAARLAAMGPRPCRVCGRAFRPKFRRDQYVCGLACRRRARLERLARRGK